MFSSYFLFFKGFYINIFLFESQLISTADFIVKMFKTGIHILKKGGNKNMQKNGNQREELLISKMKARLDTFPYPKEVLEICKRFEEKGYSCFLVGGCVRDILLGRNPQDFDFATDARPEETLSLFKHTVPTGIKFGTVTVLINRKSFEVTTFRGEGAYHDGRRPEIVSFKRQIEEDLARRDFTLNAMAYHPLEKKLVDLFNGLRDLAKGVVRTVKEPEERLLEDGLRIMRAFRFMKFGRLDTELIEAIKKHRGVLQKISKERIRAEFVKIMEYQGAVSSLRAMADLGIFEVIYKEISVILKNRELWEYVLNTISLLSDMLYTHRFAVLFSFIGFEASFIENEVPDFTKMEIEVLKRELKKSEKVTKKLLRRNTFSRKEILAISSLISDLWLPYYHLRENGQDLSSLRLTRVFYRRNALDVFKIARAREKAAGRVEVEQSLKNIQKILEELSMERHKKPVIDGNTIMAELGIPQSRKVGVFKERLYRFQVRNDVTEREVLLKELKRMAEEEK
ncbi:MAG TPA: CCA tRNA nucleotidyltransferase [Thermoplasmata archaeon]|nr:CCA tRNA nucleotidyltransferase [Thermoplasmata archaeon]